MLRIGFCDDFPLAVEQLKNIVEAYLTSEKIEADYLLFSEGNELANATESMDILFLDIEMPGMSGIEAGIKYRLNNHDCNVIIATAQKIIQKEVFDVNPIQYITKPFVREEVELSLKKVLMTMSRHVGNREITVFKKRSPLTVKEKQVQYFKAEYGNVQVSIKNKEGYYRMESSLQKITDTVDSRLFANISRQYLINLSCVDRCDISLGTISIGKNTLKITKRYKKSFIEKLQKYDLNDW